MVRFREELPPDCPPQESDEITAPLVVYRLTATLPPTDEDFRSHRAMFPDKEFSGSECEVRGLSVYAEQRDAKRQTRSSGRLRDYHVSRLLLEAGAGFLQQTRAPTHHTWWPLEAYNVLSSFQDGQ